jgi:hypothetical protein
MVRLANCGFASHTRSALRFSLLTRKVRRRLTRISYASSRQPPEFVRSTYRGDRSKLVSRLKANQNPGNSEITRKPVVVASESAGPATPAARARGWR